MAFSIKRCNTNKFTKELEKGEMVDGFVPKNTLPNNVSQDEKEKEDKRPSKVVREPGGVKMHKTIYAYSDR